LVIAKRCYGLGDYLILFGLVYALATSLMMSNV
jgi:hypothetical protein